MGHAYSPDSLLADHTDGLERARGPAVRTFDERASLLRRLGQRSITPIPSGQTGKPGPKNLNSTPRQFANSSTPLNEIERES